MTSTSKLFIAAAFLGACTPVIYEVAGVREAKATEVAGCTLIGRVTGTPGVYGPLRDIGIDEAKKSAKERAKQEGGNTVVFDPVTPGEDVYKLTAQIYNC